MEGAVACLDSVISGVNHGISLFCLQQVKRNHRESCKPCFLWALRDVGGELHMACLVKLLIAKEQTNQDRA